ncbi:glucose-6-phosphatase 2-like isoform X2 [Platichthys flesus]|uniref:glucose-6-phosphatase 2-like isoform X2 n=1 Tax=Platichthys flesus TaxID=8260 RepID=UPI002DB8AA1D|nr:glucose-6-phosphatase 2-like isoform X2 [Platichthys flesus]
MDLVHGSGVLVIQHLQNNYREYHSFLNFMSTVGDPRNIFSVYFPLWFHLSREVGTKMIWVAVIGDWLNLIFKWILFGQRPYWWVQETTFYHNNSAPRLEQFQITCETGPGSPSGHAMGSSCVWFVMITSVLHFTRPSPSASSVQSLQRWADILQLFPNVSSFLITGDVSMSPFRFRLLRSGLWMTFWIIQMSVCISRVFIATHFPHQVILGLLSVMGIDLLWSVTKAKKWCANPEWIHLDTSPFAGLLRNLGALFGLGLAVNSEMFLQSCKGKNGNKTRFKLMCVAATLTCLQLFDLMKMPTHTEVLFYTLSFCKSASVPLAVVAVIPYCVHLLIGDEDRKLS